MDAVTPPSGSVGAGLVAKPSRLERFRLLLGHRVDPSSLGAFRIWFGVCMFVEVLRFFGHGWISRYYVEPQFLITYPGWEFVKPWAGYGMYLHFVVLGVAAAAVALGIFYRAAAIVMFLGFTYVFLLDESNYLNHFYLISLLSFLLVWMPANRWAALDLYRGRRSLSEPTVPFWPVFLLRAQLAIVYFYSGIARINSDWLRGQPMGEWLYGAMDWPLIGWFFQELWAPLVMSWGGMAFDLLVVPMLLWRRTRPFAFAWAFCFHFLNLFLFKIGIFPWLAMGATLIFAGPNWPKRAGAWLQRRVQWVRARRGGNEERPGESWNQPRTPIRSGAPVSRFTIAALAAYILVQLTVPLRHWFYPGNVSWTEEGHVLSWHMMLRSKAGDLRSLTVSHPFTGETVRHDASADLTFRQLSKTTTTPRMLLKYVHWVADRYEKRWGVRPEVRVDLWVTLNDRPPQRIVDPYVDLARVTLRPGPSDWIVPLRASAPPGH